MTPRQLETWAVLCLGQAGPPQLPGAGAWGAAGTGRAGAGGVWLPVIMVWTRNRLESRHRTRSAGSL